MVERGSKVRRKRVYWFKIQELLPESGIRYPVIVLLSVLNYAGVNTNNFAERTG